MSEPNIVDNYNTFPDVINVIQNNCPVCTYKYRMYIKYA